MKTTIDGAGRLVLPKAIREAAGLYAGAEIEIILGEDDVIELHPAPRAVTIERRGPLYVAVPVEPGPGLSQDVVQATIDALRSERMRRQWDVDTEP